MSRRLFVVLISSGWLLASCTPIVENRGHVTNEDDFKQIIPGQTSEDDVRALLGSPSTASNFGTDVWYYITEQKQTVGAFAPQVTEQQVTEVHFDENKTVASIETKGKDDGKPVQMVEKTTPSEGRHLTVVEQMLSNFGRFATPGRNLNPNDIIH